MTIIYTDEVMLHLEELTDVLCEKGYFGLLPSAQKYVHDLIKEFETVVSFKQNRPASPHFARYGTNLFYITHRKNKHTTWYLFFNHYRTQDIYYIRYITNNHMAGHLL